MLMLLLFELLLLTLVIVFLKITIGSNTPEMTVTNQIISGAINHVVIPFKLRPFVSKVVRTRTTNVVTKAMPPLKAGMCLIASFKINGASIICAIVKNTMLAKSPNQLISNPSNSSTAASSPTAFPSSVSTDCAMNRIMGYSPKICFFLAVNSSSVKIP